MHIRLTNSAFFLKCMTNCRYKYTLGHWLQGCLNLSCVQETGMIRFRSSGNTRYVGDVACIANCLQRGILFYVFWTKICRNVWGKNVFSQSKTRCKCNLSLISLHIKHWLYVLNQIKYPRVLLFAAPSSCVRSRTNIWGLISGDCKAISETEIIITLVLLNTLTSRLYLLIGQRRPIAWI